MAVLCCYCYAVVMKTPCARSVCAIFNTIVVFFFKVSSIISEVTAAKKAKVFMSIT